MADKIVQPGGGLGLSIAKAIADRHGVKIVLSNRAKGCGLIAKLIFPHHRAR